uniref:ABC transporter permease n=2 Tax=Tepidimonas sp. TaxID=2002775 RepID=UPI002FE211FC
ALQWLGGDLGGGYFAGVTPALQGSWLAVLGYGALGVLAAILGGWWPALAVRGLAPAQALKGVPMQPGHAPSGARAWVGPALMALGAALCLLPPVAGLPLGAYMGIAALLVGGILALPAAVTRALSWLAPRAARRPLALLAVERARRYPGSAAVATSGVVASLALSVALTVMVGSFRQSMMTWLDAVLPADLYVRALAGGRDAATLDPVFIDAVRRLPGVVRVDGQRQRTLILDPQRPPVTLLARPLRDAQGAVPATLPLPLVGLAQPLPPAADAVGVWVSEAVVDLYGAQVGQSIALPGLGPAGTRFVVVGVWRDYARQQGSVVLDAADFARLTGDTAINDLAVFLAPGAAAEPLQRQIEALAAGQVQVSSAQAIRRISMNIFDRSFAVTYWLQAIAIGMGLMGVSASFSAQVLVRRREFGLLRHLGLSRAQVLGLVTAEGALWTVLGAVAGLALGLAVSTVLVHVVNPQSFHWTMELAVPIGRLAALALAVVAAGTLTAWASGRLAVRREAVLAVREEA